MAESSVLDGLDRGTIRSMKILLIDELERWVKESPGKKLEEL